MAKQKKTIILSIAAVLFLVGLLLLVSSLTKGEDGTVDPDDERIPVAPIDGKVDHVEIRWANGDVLIYDVVPDGAGGKYYAVTNFPDDVAFNQYYLQTIETLGVKFSADRVVLEESQNRSDFGLENPAVSILYESDTGDSVTLYVGDATAMQDHVYVASDRSEAVYLETMLNANAFLRALGDYIEFTLLPADWIWVEGVNLALESLLSAEVSFTDGTEPIRLRRCTPEEMRDWTTDKVPFLFESPALAYASESAMFELFVEKILSSTRGAVQTDTAENGLAEYGLDEPLAVFTISTTDETCRLLVGRSDGSETYYMMREGTPFVMYVPITAEALQFNFIDLVDDTLWGFAPGQVAAIEVVSAEKTRSITFTRSEGMLTGATDGEQDYDAAGAQALLDAAMLVQYEGLSDAPFAQADHTITLILDNGNRHELALHALNSRQMLIRLNGTDTGMYCRATALKALLD